MSDTPPDGYAFTRRVSANARVLRRRRGWSAQRLAEEMSAFSPTTRAVIANRESGRLSHVSVDDLVAYARALGVLPQELLEDVPPVACDRCLDAPPKGYTCNQCGAVSR